jgi:hypothetical protein
MIKKLQEEAKNSLKRMATTPKKQKINVKVFDYDAFELWADIYFTIILFCKETKLAREISIEIFNGLLKIKNKHGLFVKGVFNKHNFIGKNDEVTEILDCYKYFLNIKMHVDIGEVNKRIKEFLRETE